MALIKLLVQPDATIGGFVCISPRSQIDREDNDRLRSEVDELVKQLIDQLTGLENHLLLSRNW